MNSMQPAAIAPTGEPRSLGAAFTLPRVLIALSIAVLVAAALNPVFVTPFPILLGRMLVIAMLLLIAFTLAGAWKVPGLPRWLAQVLAVALVAPLATFLVYLPSIGFLAEPMRHEGFVLGYTFITGSALVLGPLLALGALYRERDAQARSAALHFELERSTLEKQALDARLKLLHAQVEPHFLFNTLANVQALVESGSPQAGPVLRSLIDYLRATMPRLQSDNPTLGVEAALVRAYLELMEMRMPDRLRYRIEIDPDLAGIRFPPMALLTLIENAVRHGIDPSEVGGCIVVSARRDPADGSVRVGVADSGVGISESTHAGTGLANLRDRLQAFFGGDARLELHAETPHGVRAEIVFRDAGGAA
jgi:signal transduction histidine kinase